MVSCDNTRWAQPSHGLSLGHGTGGESGRASAAGCGLRGGLGEALGVSGDTHAGEVAVHDVAHAAIGNKGQPRNTDVAGTARATDMGCDNRIGGGDKLRYPARWSRAARSECLLHYGHQQQAATHMRQRVSNCQVHGSAGLYYSC